VWVVFEDVGFGSGLLGVGDVRMVAFAGRNDVVFKRGVEFSVNFSSKVFRHDNFSRGSTATVACGPCTASSVILGFRDIKGEGVLGLFGVVSSLYFLVEMGGVIEMSCVGILFIHTFGGFKVGVGGDAGEFFSLGDFS
jgi:hypothetical protein